MRATLIAGLMAIAVTSSAVVASPPAPSRDVRPNLRVLPLAGGVNFRDMGGYRTRDGHVTRWHVLYRSGNMAGLTAGDYAYLDRLGIRSVCDLRSVGERRGAPVAWGAARKPDYWTSDIAEAGGDLRKVMTANPTPDRVRDAMLDLYRAMPVVQRDGYRHIFQELAAGRVPLAFNCTAGKDRTGVAAALILAALGVPRATIVEDYVLTDKVADLSRKLTGMQAPTGPSPVAAILLRADPAYITATFDAIDRRYGSVEGYLQAELGIGPADVRRMRTYLLT